MARHYTALVDGQEGAWGVYFPDLAGCTAMGDTVDEALANAQEALRDWTEAMTAMGHAIPPARSASELVRDAEVREALTEGASMARVLVVENLGRPVKANMSLDSGVLAEIDAAAKRLGVTRSALVERIAKERLPEYA